MTFNKAFLAKCAVMALFINPSVDYQGLVKIKSLDPPILKPFEKGMEGFKSPKELETYIAEEGALSKNQFEEFKENYKNLILSASQLFEIPYSLQSCLLHKESRFDEKALSHMGALGIAQFTPQTYHFLARAFRLGERRSESKIDVVEAKRSVGYKPKSPQKRTYSNHNLSVFEEMHLRWQKYLENNNLEGLELKKNAYKKVLYDPRYAIGLSSAYLYFLNHNVRYNLNKVSLYSYQNHLSQPDFYLTLAGAYNQGARRLLKAIKKEGRSGRPTLWLKHQERVRETRGYIKEIRACMTSTKGYLDRLASEEGNLKKNQSENSSSPL